jgi:hypothetical protein
MNKGEKTSAVRTLVLRELSKGPKTTAQLSKSVGASKRHINIYLHEQKAVRVGNVPRSGRGPRAAVWSLPETGDFNEHRT